VIGEGAAPLRLQGYAPLATLQQFHSRELRGSADHSLSRGPRRNRLPPCLPQIRPRTPIDASQTRFLAC
jgi:hypothetical protein